MNDIENNEVTRESEKIYNKGKEFLEALHENGLTPLEYKEMSEQEREWTDEQIAKTLKISPEEMKDKYTNQRAWAIDGSYNLCIEKLEALKEGNFEKVEEIEKELETSSELCKATKAVISSCEQLVEEYAKRCQELQERHLH